MLSPAVRLDNADSYSCFVYNLLHQHTAVLAARAAEYRGAALTLVQKPTGAIDLNSPDVKVPQFTMDGIPQSSGFQCRWVIADSSDNRYLMRSDSGDPFQFGPCAPTFIGAPTRALLRSKGITTANVLCRVQI